MSVQAGIREKIGQMLLVGFRGMELNDQSPVIHDIRERNLGGVILFDQEMADTALMSRNIESPDQVQKLVASLQHHAANTLLVAIDQEGGRVNRLKPAYGFPESLSHEELGKTDSPARTFEHAETIAKTLAALGINFNLAPVVDLDCNPDNPIIKGKKRSFSTDPEKVALHAGEFIKAHRQHGVLNCLKHFPGHGSAMGDTHLGIVDVTRTWTDKELIPFRKLIEAGLCDAIMSAHVFNAQLDPDHPATLSPSVINGLLRGQLGYQGVVMTDDMEMKAIANHYGLEESIRRAVEAGIDILCFGNNMSYDANIGEKAFGILLRLVESGAISEARIEESCARIAALKQRLNLIQ